jgi:hypothetical protein
MGKVHGVDGAKIVFQSRFMLTIVQPRFRASSKPWSSLPMED